MKRLQLAVAVTALVSLAGLGLAGGPYANAAEAPPVANQCTDPTADLDPSCMAAGAVAALVRQLCDYQWVDGVCEQYAAGVAAVRERTPTPARASRSCCASAPCTTTAATPTAIRDTIPADYYQAGRTGHNVADAGGDTGVILDFMFGSDHSDNEKLPITTRAACVDPAGIPARSPTPTSPARFRRSRAATSPTRNDHYWKWAATLRQAIEGTDFSPTERLHGLHRRAGVRVDQRLLQPHERLLLAQRRQREDRRQLRVDGRHVELAAPSGRSGRRCRRARHVQSSRR